MMLKVTIILFILAIITKVIIKVLAESMTPLEKAVVALKKDYMPKRILVSTFIWILLNAAAVVCLIITIIKW